MELSSPLTCCIETSQLLGAKVLVPAEVAARQPVRPASLFFDGFAWACSTSTEPGDSGYQSFFPFQEGTASGPDSPSHGARIIKWMSSSWWLSMA